MSAFDSLAPARALLADCEAEAADAMVTSGACSLYLAGVFEALALENLAQMEDAQKRTCPPSGPVGIAELRRIFIDYGRSHEDQLDEHRIWTVSAALHEAFPCK